MGIYDPRGRIQKKSLQFAPRLSQEELSEGPILFYNNTKLNFCAYPELYPALKRLFTEREITNFLDREQSPRGKEGKGLRDFARELKDSGAKAVILGLADIGVTPATTILTIYLEELGVPSVLLTAGPGVELARGTAYYRAGRLCLCPLETYQASLVEEIESEAERIFPDIMHYLTATAEELEKTASIDFPMDKSLPRADGFLDDAALPIDASGLQKSAANTLREFTDYCLERHLGDGFPLVPPEEDAVNEMLKYAPSPDPEEVIIADCGPAGNDIRVHDIAVNAVMAGCRPEYLPVLITAFQAMADPRYSFFQSVTTSHAGGNLLIVSGPIAAEIGIHGGQGCIGPGFHANATIGRAVNLTIINTVRAVPGVCDLDCLASPAEFSYCFAEDPALSPWRTINAERYDADTTTVFVLKAEPPHDVIEYLSTTGKHLLETLAGTCTSLGTNNVYIPGNLILAVTPDHARLLARDGFDKDKIRQYIFEKVRNPADIVRNRGIIPVRPDGFSTLDPIPVTRSPEDVEVVVAGGKGGHSAVILPWALRSEAIVKPLTLTNGSAAHSVKDYSYAKRAIPGDMFG